MRLAVGLVVLAGLGLRLFLLDGQSLWYDEGVSAYMTPRTFAQIAEATAVDIHPPLYYWLLSLWAVPFGQGELALRAYSVLLGTLTVWVTWRLGRAIGGTRVGLAAAALLAISPLAVQYSQEVRMYAQAGLLAAASSWAGLALLRALADDATTRRRVVLLGAGYGLVVAALLYTHYYGSLVVVAQQAYAGMVVLRARHWRLVPVWGLATGGAALLFLPWLPVALRQTGYYPGLGTPQPAGALLLDVVNVLSIGIATTRFAFRAGLAPFLGLAALGAWALGSPHPPLPGGPHPSPPSPMPESRAADRDRRCHPERSELASGVEGSHSRAVGSGDPSTPLLRRSAQDDRGGGLLRRSAQDDRGVADGLPLARARARGAGGEGHPAAGGEGQPRPAGEGLLLLLWIAIPILGILLLSRTRPLYEPRFLMLVLPAWTILLGAGIVALGQGAGALLAGRLRLPVAARAVALAGLAVLVGGMLLVPTARSLGSYFFDPAYARDDYRGLARTVMLREQPGDAIVLTAPGQVEIFGYYYRGNADVYPLPRQRPIDPVDTLAQLDALGAGHRRVWLVRWAAVEADPDDLIPRWLEANGRAAGARRFGAVELRLYELGAVAAATGRRPTAGAADGPVDADLAGAVARIARRRTL